MRSLLAACFSLAAALAAPLAAEARPFTPKDMASMERVSDPRLSPDGKRAVYSLRKVDFDANKATHEIWYADWSINDGPRRLLVSDGGASSPRWSPAGDAIYFLSSRSGVNQVWRTDWKGVEATQITSLPLDVDSFRLSPDGRRLIVQMSVFADCAADFDCTVKRTKAKEAASPSGQVFDRLFLRHWDSWADGRRNALFSLELDASGVAGKPVAIAPGLDADTPSKPFGDDSEYLVTPDGRTVLFAARISGRTEAWSTNFDIYAAPVDGSAPPRNLTAANPAWDTPGEISPDGRTLAYRAMARPGFEADRFGIRLLDLASGETRELAADWDRSADKLAWAPDGKSLFVLAQDVGQARIFEINVKKGDVKALTGDGVVNAFEVARGRSGPVLLYSRDDLASPAQIYRLERKKVAQVTSHAADVISAVEFGGFEQFSFSGWNNETVYGYLIKPHGFDPAKRYPVAFLVHGGPQGSFNNHFHYRWNPQTYAGMGYAVVMIDFHGSTGYGQGFTDSISGHWGDRPLEDLKKGWAHALKAYPFLDGGRACALGGSYGGYMMAWIAGNWPDGFKCLVNHAGVFDTRFMGYATEELWFTEWENGGPLHVNQAGYEAFNPIRMVANWVTPMLVIHGAKDFRVPLDQGIAAFTALQRKGVDSKFLYFPDENHWILKPKNSVQWHEEVGAWLKKYAPPN